jgi:hypothetical protein
MSSAGGPPAPLTANLVRPGTQHVLEAVWYLRSEAFFFDSLLVCCCTGADASQPPDQNVQPTQAERKPSNKPVSSTRSHHRATDLLALTSSAYTDLLALTSSAYTGHQEPQSHTQLRS